MRPIVARLGGVALALVSVAVGIAIGRVIEAIAVAAVLFAAWTYVRRFAAAPDDAAAGSDSDR